jgi:hypothetical protein
MVRRLLALETEIGGRRGTEMVDPKAEDRNG